MFKFLDMSRKVHGLQKRPDKAPPGENLGELIWYCFHMSTDKKNGELVLQIGSSSKVIHDEVIAIYKLCRQHAFRLYPEWVPRKQNSEADYLSCQTDPEDYMLNPLHFAALDIMWGPHIVDRFSSFNTRQIPRFCSRWLSPCSETVDAFTVDWSGENNWIFPPPHLIPRVISHMCFNKQEGTLIVPLWSSASSYYRRQTTYALDF